MRFEEKSKKSSLDSKGSCSPSRSIVSSRSSSSSEEEDVAADDVDSELTSDSDESTASSVSFKSDDSKDELIDFKGRLSPRLNEEVEELRLENMIERNHLADLSLKLKRVGDDLSEQSLKSKRFRLELTKLFLNYKGRLSVSMSDFSSSSEEEEDAADDDCHSGSVKSMGTPASFEGRCSPSRKLDESGLPTNQEFTVGEILTIRLCC